MIYLGIDQSYSGFALAWYDPAEDGHDVTVKSFDPKVFGAGVDRLLTIYTWLRSEVQRLSHLGTISHVAMEGYANGAKFGREVAGELGAVVKMALRGSLNEPACYPSIIAPTALKKFVTGSGSAAKNQMLLGVYKKWGVEFTDDNAADAYALARLAYEVTEKAT